MFSDCWIVELGCNWEGCETAINAVHDIGGINHLHNLSESLTNKTNCIIVNNQLLNGFIK